MADEMVLRAQRFINTTYGNGATLGISKLAEDGKTGWTVMYALTRALQYEMGISALSNNFGPGTMAALAEKYGKVDETTVPSANFCRIIQSALYCKGYDGGDIDGTYNSRVKSAVLKLHQDMGVSTTYPGSSLWPKVIKGLFNMDAYVSVNNGSETIRSIQQWLNGNYVLRSDFYIIPCDGHHSRDVAKSLLFAIQYELGMADGTANGGVFGPGTQSGLKNHVLSTGSSGVWVQLFTAGMVLNGRPVSFSGSYSSSLASAVSTFQSFMMLAVNGQADFRTWSCLLVSYGDQTREGAACDGGVTKITPARAQALKAAGYKYVGRYLYNPSTTDLPEKEIQPGELATIEEYGLRCYPIYQTWARSVDYYSPDQQNRLHDRRVQGGGARLQARLPHLLRGRLRRGGRRGHRVHPAVLPQREAADGRAGQPVQDRGGLRAPQRVHAHLRRRVRGHQLRLGHVVGLLGQPRLHDAHELGVRPARHQGGRLGRRPDRDRQQHRLRAGHRPGELLPAPPAQKMDIGFSSTTGTRC